MMPTFNSFGRTMANCDLKKPSNRYSLPSKLHYKDFENIADSSQRHGLKYWPGPGQSSF